MTFFVCVCYAIWIAYGEEVAIEVDRIDNERFIERLDKKPRTRISSGTNGRVFEYSKGL